MTSLKNRDKALKQLYTDAVYYHLIHEGYSTVVARFLSWRMNN